jgi:two-component system cell cycle sensor histidine kinase/response regulator CckA
MEALARLGAGVAHDFNNILTAITLNIDFLRQQYRSDFVLSQALGELLDIGARGQRIAQQLLTFSKVKPHSPRSLNITRAVTEMRTALTALLGDNFVLELQVTDEAVAVHADPAQVDQVLMNLVINARDAMPQGGRVTVKLSATSDMAILSISDEGVGIDPGTLGRIFEPFFTTKGHGTGLGLSIVHSIVEQNGGTIAVVSEPGAGATFIIRIPRI